MSTTTDQRRALEGADFVVVTISTGGFESMAVDLDVPARHGIRQSVGDRVGPGGISRSLRNIPVLVGIGRDMEEDCPDAWMLNITNPMTALTRAVCRETRSRPSASATRWATSASTWPSPSASPTPRATRGRAGSTTFRSSPSSTSTDATASRCSPSMVEELGGLYALAPEPGP